MGIGKDAKLFKFTGCYRIVHWELFRPGSAELDTFLAWRQKSELFKFACPWAHVFVEKVINPILSGDPSHRYVIRYALHIMIKEKDRALKRCGIPCGA
jgi:hypothetical protein